MPSQSMTKLRQFIDRANSELTPAMRYHGLRKAKQYAGEHRLPFPSRAQKELRYAALETLRDVAEYMLEHGSEET